LIGIGLALGAVILTFVLKGVSPMILINLPSISIVMLGTFGATIASYGLAEFLRLPKLLAIGMKAPSSNSVVLRGQLIAFAERARREGLLALESDVEIVTDPFVRHGLQMVIDGLEPETVEGILELQVEAMSRRHAHGAVMLAAMAGYAPTFGILGAVMGLVAVMAHLSEPAKLGAGIQVAFIATLMAVGIANIVYMPMSVSLKAHSAVEVTGRRMAMAGILAIQAGDNPRIVAQKLDTFLDPHAAPKVAKEPSVESGSRATAAAGMTQSETA
jgi:chemotaxis protein MotA